MSAELTREERLEKTPLQPAAGGGRRQRQRGEQVQRACRFGRDAPGDRIEQTVRLAQAQRCRQHQGRSGMVQHPVHGGVERVE